MCAISTALIAVQNSAQFRYISLTFCHMISGSSSQTFHIEFEPVLIFACFARLRAFSMKMTVVYTSSPAYFSFFPRSSTFSLNLHNSLSNSVSVHLALSTGGKQSKNEILTSFQGLLVSNSLNHLSAGEANLRWSPNNWTIRSFSVMRAYSIKWQNIFKNFPGWISSSGSLLKLWTVTGTDMIGRGSRGGVVSLGSADCCREVS